MKKPSSISGNADREAVWHGGWDMDSRLPGVKPQVWDWGVAFSGREFASYESPKFHLWDPFSQIMGLQLLGCMTLRKTAPPSPSLSFFVCKEPSRQ